MPSPLFEYPLSRIPLKELDRRHTELRRLTHRGRGGVVSEHVFGAVVLGPHHLAEPKGSLSLWVMALEDLHTAQVLDSHNLHIPSANEITLISDRESVWDSHAAHFAIVKSTHWTPSFYMKRFPGHVYQAFKSPAKAVSAAGHFSMPAGRWLQILYVWDNAANHHVLYANGVRIGCGDSTQSKPLAVSPPGPFLCVGSPMLAHGDVRGYAEAFDDAGARALYAAEEPSPDPDFQAELERIYLGRGIAPLLVPQGDGWETRLEASLCEPDALRLFEVQGCPQAPTVSDEGLRITTPLQDPLHDFSVLDLNHVYLWSRESYEGDLHLSYEFQNLREGGLSLLMTRCSGMQREDTRRCHRPQTNGIMKTVCWEDVRNYHWEYLREMNDVRNDVASHALIKNPWFRALGFGIQGPRFALGSWHRLDFVQTGADIQCAIDGQVVITARDSAEDNNGPVFSTGRFAIRCMTRTDIRIRHLRVRTRPQYHFDAE